jgi:hypothetical protein
MLKCALRRFGLRSEWAPATIGKPVVISSAQKPDAGKRQKRGKSATSAGGVPESVPRPAEIPAGASESQGVRFQEGIERAEGTENRPRSAEGTK